MKQKPSKLLLVMVMAGGLLFNLLFWQEKIGLNLILYELFLLPTLFYWYPAARHTRIQRWLLPAHLLCTAMVLLHNGLLAKYGCLITLGLVTGFREYRHRSVWYAGGSMVLNSSLVLPELITLMQDGRDARKTGKWRLKKTIRLAVLPLMLLSLFTLLYRNGNTVFEEWLNNLGTYLGDWADWLLSLFSFSRLLFLLLGIYLTGALLLKSRIGWFETKETAHKDQLERKRTSMKTKMDRPGFIWSSLLFGRMAKSNLSLKYFHAAGLGSLIVLNVLLLVVNSIDIRFLWFNPEYARQTHLYQLVHEGTDMLLLSLLLAISVLLIFFRGNLNFFSGNRALRLAAYAWLLQNLVLAISLFFRDYYYIKFAGLAYKRIGVMFFLVMVLSGLITVFLKIQKRRSMYFLFRVNGWVALGLLVASCTVNWDPLIASYNLAHRNETPMDVEFMATLTNKAIPILDAHRPELAEAMEQLRARGFGNASCSTCYLEIMNANREAFLRGQEKYSWLSWNLADRQIEEYFRNKPQKQ